MNTYTINPLEWTSVSIGSPGKKEREEALRSWACCGFYYISRRENEGEYEDNTWSVTFPGFLTHCTSLEAAKQAAQDHWEERLMGALLLTGGADA